MWHTADHTFDLVEARERLQETLEKIWRGELENDGFNRLVMNAGLTCRQVTILRAYARYMRQIAFPFSQAYIEETLVANAKLANLLIALFNARFHPTKQNLETQQQTLVQIETALDQVESLDDDRIIRRYSEMILATLRTNYFQTDSKTGSEKTYLSLKLLPSMIPEIPKPVPTFEIFVYSPDVEGVHLRGGKVARGGLRWSDRPEDFRTEVLGLVKAQQVKNTVILPVGAKGGFVCKKTQNLSGRDEIFAEGQRCYQIFIQGLLDITDNIQNGQVVPPVDLVCHDEPDAYLVVAADKGTATFSDLANKVSKTYDFWLGDAFASGGSNGYDHKAMGITAKGGWESVKRHFRELGIDCQTTDFTCIGIGDMAGDVFGNGMLLSKHIRLKAAFNHLHIFIDPNPNAATSWKERSRLFQQPRSGWDDYNPKLISKGGGIFSRKAKSIKLTPEIKQWLGVSQASLAPNDLIHCLLKSEVDLLWNGGIGTYVKARHETHLSVGDRANDALRVNGEELGAKIVGEGGNLGLTQQGRIEYALQGGRVNTDFIDNVGGVDCSDNEVNIKILLNTLVTLGDLTVKQRNDLLVKMSDDVEQIVLRDAYLQSESISVACHKQQSLLKEQIRFIHALEKEGKLDRQLEFILDDETLLERLLIGQGLTRPENAVLLAYGKMVLKAQLVMDEITQEPHFMTRLPNYFPNALSQDYVSVMDVHPLKREIIATSLANEICNEMGFNYVNRLHEETGASVLDIVKSYAISRGVLHLDEFIESIRQMDHQISTELQYELLFQVQRMVRRASRWLLRNPRHDLSVDQLITLYQPVYEHLIQHLSTVLVPHEFEDHRLKIESMMAQECLPRLQKRLNILKVVFQRLTSQITADSHQSIDLVARLYFSLGERLSLHWFLDQINEQPVENHWQGLARASFREELDWQQRQITAKILKGIQKDQSMEDLLDHWFETHSVSIRRWQNIISEFKVGTVHEFAKFSVALRELMLLNVYD